MAPRGRLCEDPLRTKFAVAYNVELDPTDGNPVGDGVLGSALDEATERALPYARRVHSASEVAGREPAERALDYGSL
jgi:hypothetical protein